MIPHSSKHLGAPTPIPVYLPGRSQTPEQFKQETSDEDDDDEDDDCDNGEEPKLLQQNLEKLIPQASLPNPNFFALMSNWVNASASTASMNSQFLGAPMSSANSASIINKLNNSNNSDNNEMSSSPSSNLMTRKVI